jgi:hypothetical protein
MLGLATALTADAAMAWLGCVAAIVLVTQARHRQRAIAAALVAAACFGGAAALDTPVIAAVSGALFLGAVTAEMMLGHWYLVDPQLPRWALRWLVIGATVAAVVDVVVVIGFGAIPWASTDTAVGVGFIVLAVVSIVLLLAVIGALREPGYAGVMSATGLSYLALLTTIGAVVVGRMLAVGPVLG